MFKKDIAKILRIHSSAFSTYISRGIVDNPPDDYIYMNECQLFKYIEKCRFEIKEYLSSLPLIMSRGKNKNWDLPKTYQDYEKHPEKFYV
jgi:hypothetical protein